MGRIILALGLFLIAAGQPRAADILETLKTHKIVLGHGCMEPCTPPPMNPIGELRVIDGYVVVVSKLTKTGYIYPIGREESVLEHPLMKGYFERSTLRYTDFRTRATASGDQLTLSLQSTYDRAPGEPITTVSTERIVLSAGGCTTTRVEEARGKSGLDDESTIKGPCEVAPLADTVGQGKEPQWSSLTFADVRDPSIGRSREQFSLLNNHLFHNIMVCKDASWLAVEFDWSGGASSGSHKCDTVTGPSELRYSSDVKVDGDSRKLTGTATWVTHGQFEMATDYEFDIRVSVDDAGCRIDKFYKRVAQSASSADAQTRCFLDR